jgi:VWFA-related protein
LAQTLLTALNDSQSIAQEQHTLLSLAGLLALVRSQQTIGDRKVIIYFTQNRQLDKDSKKMLETISGAAAQAGVTIYTVDMDAIAPGGKQMDNANLHAGQQQFVNAPAQESAQPIHGPVIIGANGYPAGNNWGQAQDIAVMTDFMRNGPEDLTDPFADSKSPMAAFSKATGGAYIDAQNSTTKPLQQMVQDLTTYYQASYVPPFKDYDGKFRTIHVKPLRTGLEIQTKTGYFALAGDAESGIQPFEAPLLKALAEPKLPTELEFHAAVLRFGDLPDGNTSTVGVEVPIAELEAKRDPKSNLSSAHVSIVVQIKDATGTVIEHYSKDIVKRGATETLDRDRTATVALERHFVTTPGKYTMEVAVLDQNSGKTGAERTEFEIPDRAGALSISDMILVRDVEGSHEEEIDPLEPLRYEHRKVTPNLTGEMPANDKNVSLFFILHPDPASNEPTTLEMQLIHNGKAGARIPLLHVDGERGPIPYLANVKSHALAPGVYQVKAFLSQGGKTTEELGTFRVAGTPGTEAANADSNWFESASIGADTADQPTAAPSKPPSELAIVALAKPAAPPPQDEATKLVDDARQRALDFNETLPNFTCTEVTKRSVDFNGDGKWRTRDTLTELLSYRDRMETRTMLEVNGNASHTDRGAMKGVFSAGEFGGVLQAVFRNESKADFKWRETDSLNSGTVEVYDYHVDSANSTFSVIGSEGKQVKVGFHGQVFIDGSTHRARRVTLTADNLPANFSTHATSISVDYDYVPINGLKYLVPVSAELELKQGLHEAMVNTMEFRDYKRFASNEPNP